jgi:Na+/melibiose symporter-like transporter
MPHNIVPVLSALTIAFLFFFSLWWLRRAERKFPELTLWAKGMRNLYLIFCLVLFVPSAALVLKGAVTWQQMVTGSMLAIIFYLMTLMLLLAPIHQRALRNREKSQDT